MQMKISYFKIISTSDDCFVVTTNMFPSPSPECIRLFHYLLPNPAGCLCLLCIPVSYGKLLIVVVFWRLSTLLLGWLLCCFPPIQQPHADDGVWRVLLACCVCVGPNGHNNQFFELLVLWGARKNRGKMSLLWWLRIQAALTLMAWAVRCKFVGRGIGPL